MKNKITTFIANAIRPTVFWLLDRLIEKWRKDLPKYQEMRYKSNGSPLWKRITDVRGAIHAWDRIKADPRRDPLL